MKMRTFFKWLVSPHVAPLIARLLLVAATALATEPEAALGLGASLEALVRDNRL